MKKWIAVFVCLCMILPSAMSCSAPTTGDGEGDAEEAGSVSETTVPEASDPEEVLSDYDLKQLIPDNLPERSFDGQAFRVLTKEDDYNGEIVKREEILVDELTGDVCNDAVFNRNLLIESRFDAVIKCETHASPQDYISTVVQAGSDDYELVGMYNHQAKPPIIAGTLLNWREIPYVDLTQPWHNQLANDNCTVYGKLFAACSDLSVSSMTYTYAFFFNLALLADYGYQSSDLYGKVKEGTWTFDTFTSLIETMYQDKNGDGKKDKGDTYGFGYCVVNPADAWTAAFDIPLTEHTEDGGITTNFLTDKSVSALEKLLELHYNNPGYFKYSEQYAEEANFCNKKLVFAPLRIYAAYTDLREMEDAYSLLPWPKWDEAQESYRTNADDKFTVFGVPLTAHGDEEFVGILYEALSAESYKKVYPAYFDTALKGKYSSEPETAEMVDIVMAGRAFDIAFELDNIFGGLAWIYRDSINANSSDIASTYASIRKIVEKLGPKVIDQMYGD